MPSEIGSEFWDIPLSQKENGLFNDATWFISGRAALRSILRQIRIDHNWASYKVALPSFLCSSMIEPLMEENVAYGFYPVEISEGGLRCDYSRSTDCNVILLMDYFGYEVSNETPSFSDKIVIRDLTHSIFVKRYDDADFYFGSLRKWAGFLGGGFAVKRNGHLIGPTLWNGEFHNLRERAMLLKKAYLAGERNSKDYLELFQKAETMLDDCEISSCETRDVSCAKRFDVDLVKHARRTNARVLIQMLKDYCMFPQLRENDCPLCVPILCGKRDKLRNYLTSLGIYCPIHWPRPEELVGGFSKRLYDEELSLVCDQRYDERDMRRIANAVLSFLGGYKNA